MKSFPKKYNNNKNENRNFKTGGRFIRNEYSNNNSKNNNKSILT